MTKNFYQFRFDSEISLEDIEDTLMLVLVAVNSLHGVTRVRLDCQFVLDKKRRHVLVDGNTPVGRCFARILAGFADYAYGETGFRFRRIAFAGNEGSVVCQDGALS